METDEQNSCARLTRRESEVLRALAGGKSSKEIAREMTVAPRTVEVYIDRLRLKLRAKTRAHMTAIGVSQGLVQQRS